ncbi:hypothetical protein ACP70R_005258 [Stipagrostis hirtigluma subsp. patula]
MEKLSAMELKVDGVELVRRRLEEMDTKLASLVALEYSNVDAGSCAATTCHALEWRQVECQLSRRQYGRKADQ